MACGPVLHGANPLNLGGGLQLTAGGVECEDVGRRAVPSVAYERPTESAAEEEAHKQDERAGLELSNGTRFEHPEFQPSSTEFCTLGRKEGPWRSTRGRNVKGKKLAPVTFTSSKGAKY